MKIHKLLFLAMLSALAVSCSQDTFENKSTDDLNQRLASDEFDNTYQGLYKGLFTTNDGLTRGSVEIQITPNNEGVAKITLSSGEMIELTSPKIKLTADNRVSNLHFSSEGAFNATLNFSVNGDGIDPLVSDVTFDSKESDILIAKNLSRAPITPITGTYDCTNCAASGVGFPNGRTWNVMSIVEGNNQNFAIQVSYGNRVYTSPAANNSQNGCTDIAQTYTVCGIAGSVRILGNDVTWNGTHVYAASDDLACSDVNGAWNAPSFGPGLTGTFQSDSDCSNPVPVAPENDLFANAIALNCGDGVSGTTIGATQDEASAPSTVTGGGTDTPADNDSPWVWYSYTGSGAAEVVTLSTCGTSQTDYDTEIFVYTGTSGNLTLIDDGYDECGGSSENYAAETSFTSDGNTTYYIAVGGWNSGDVGNFTLNLSCNTPPPPTTYSLTPGCGTTLVDNGEDANYSSNTNDSYSIDAGVGNVVSLPFSVFNLENTWDFMRIYNSPDGVTLGAEITNVNGRVHYVHATNPARVGFTGAGTGLYSLQDQTVVSSGQYLIVQFLSDNIITAPGFLAVVGCNPARVGADSHVKTSATFTPPISSFAPEKEVQFSSEAEKLEYVARKKLDRK